MKDNVSVKNKVIEINDFANGINYDLEIDTNCKYALNGYGFDYRKGVLQEGLGMQDLLIRPYPYMTSYHNIQFENPARVFMYCIRPTHEKYVMLISSDNKLYQNSLNTVGYCNFVEVFSFVSKPEVMFYSYNNSNYLLFRDEQYFYVYSGSLWPLKKIKHDSSYLVNNVTVHNDRLYLTFSHRYENFVHYTSDLNPLNIYDNASTMQSIMIPRDCGNIIKLVSFNDYLYVFCEFGIYRIVTYETKRKNYIEKVYDGMAKIYKETIVFADQKIMFMTSKGLATFNGIKVTLANLNINKIWNELDNLNACAVYANGLYYISCELDFGDNQKVDGETYTSADRHSLIVVDVEKQKAIIHRGLCVLSLTTIPNERNKVACVNFSSGTRTVREICFGGECEKNVPSHKLWVGSYYDFDQPNKLKICRKIYFKASNDITLKVRFDDKEKSFSITGSTKEQCVVLNERAYKFGLTFACDKSKIKISDVKMVVGFYEWEYSRLHLWANPKAS